MSTKTSSSKSKSRTSSRDNNHSPEETKRRERRRSHDRDQERVSDVETPQKEVVVAPVEVKPTTQKKQRRVPTRDTVIEELDGLVTMINSEVERLRGAPAKTKGVKFLRSLNKRVKTLKSDVTRVTRQRQKTTRKTNNNSGFLKPVKISRQMAEFTGWNPDELKSRVDVTRYICDYIKKNGLNDQKDKRNIKPDPKLSKLLGYDPKRDEKDLTYFRLQAYMKPHFPKEEAKESGREARAVRS